MLPLGDFHTHISRAQIRGSAKRRNGRWVSTGGVIARSPGAYNNRQSSDRSHWSAGKSTSQVYLPHSESNASGQYGIVKRTSSRRASKAAAARRQPTFRRTRGVSSLAQRSTILEADTRQRPLPKFRELSGHGEQAESLGEQPQGHASGMLPMKFRNPATLEAADSRMDVPAPTLARLTDLRTKMRPEKTKYFIGSGPEEQEYRRISQAVMTSLTRLLASLRYAIDSDIGHIYQTELVISKLGLRLSKPLLNTAIHIAQRYIHSCVTWDSFQRGHHRQSPIGRLQVLHDLRQQDRHSVERAFNCSWNEVYIGSLLLQKYQELTGRLSRRAARRVYYTFIAPLTHTHQEIMTMLMLGYKEYKDASKIERAITQLYKSLSSICGAVGKILYSRPLTPSGRYRYSELHPYALFSLLRHFKMSSQELKAHIGDLRILRANLGALSDAERRASRQGEGLNLQYWNLTETQTQQNGLPAYLEYEGKGDNSLGLNDSKIQPRLSLGGLPPSEEADRHQLDARRGLHPKSEGDIRSQVQHASPQIYLSSKGTRKEDFSSSQVKRLPQTTWSKDPQSQSGVYSVDSRTLVRKSRQRVAAYHTSANRESSAAATAALETTNASKTDDNQVCATGATNERQAGSPLGYYIPSDRMRESMLASRSSRSAYWQYTLYRGPKREKVMVHYCKRLETTERISKLFLNESVIGFDIEWKPAATVKDGIRKNVATIQIASEERIALFHIARFSKGDSVEDLVAPSFKQIMESPSITKVGVSVKSDCTRLRKFMNIDSRGLFELSHLYKLVKFASDDVKKINKKLVSLATQVEEHLMLPMYKDENVRASDWSEELDYEQIYYAASDSYAGFQLYHILNNKRLSLAPTPPLPAHAELNLPIRLANGQTVAEHEDPVAGEPALEPTHAPLSSTERLAEDVLNLQIEDKSVPPATQPSKPNPKTKPSPSSSPSLSSHPSIIAANEWIKQYRASTNPSTISSIDTSYPLLPPTSYPSLHPTIHSPPATTTNLSSTSTTTTAPTRPRALPSHLRAFFLFHHHGLSIKDIAALLRAPPLQSATVAGYILEAVRLEGLSVEGGRMEECLEFVGKGYRGRWRV